MKKEQFLANFFSKQRKKELDNTPSFDQIFRRAQVEKQRTQQQKRYLLVASIACLLIIGFAINDDITTNNWEEIPIAKSSTNLYHLLMTKGKIVTNDIYFEYNKATIKPASFAILKDMATMLKAHPKVKLHIEGHTDSSGPTSHNQRLSEKRANAVKAALEKLGIATDRLTAEGFGEAQPLNEDTTEEERALNRRVAFVLVE